MLGRRTLSDLLLGALTWLLVLSSLANAAPARISNSGYTLLSPSRRVKPRIPRTKQELRDIYFMQAPPKDKSCFFSGMKVRGVKADPVHNTLWAKLLCHGAGLTTIDDLWTEEDMSEPSFWEGRITASAYERIIIWMSQIFAEETTGTAYLVIADSLEPKTASIFFRHEFGAIKAGGKVTEIKRLNFSNMWINDPTTGRIWWKKGDEDPLSWP
ncbi:hypothetical protein BDU57DRAFT_523077 [Ampelomyces quisqualis]|uniref:Uncharacterized protein n=1 Tax=Ampelomyces quisqualis TaxID=50730 RepID=A0A6A5QAX8_AMPQU|nr:hypothetical protein BDU57DRAFT_523077 [Ampelomyces quisqualis]